MTATPAFNRILPAACVLLLCAALLCAGCTLSAGESVTPMPDAALLDVTPDEGGLPRIGEAGLLPSGAGPCVLTAGAADVVVYTEANTESEPMAILNAGTGWVAFELDASGWYGLNVMVRDTPQVGYVAAAQVAASPDCQQLIPPEVCSARPVVDVATVYAEPRRDADVLGTLGGGLTAPLLDTHADGWMQVDLGGGASGWIAPGEAMLVGC